MAGSRSKTKVLGYAEIAELLGVDVKSVRIYRGRDADFPEPVTPAGFRSPGFDEVDVLRWIKLREVRRLGKSGAPPRTARAAAPAKVEVVAKKTSSRATPAAAKTATKVTEKAPARRGSSPKKPPASGAAASEASTRATRAKKAGVPRGDTPDTESQ